MARSIEDVYDALTECGAYLGDREKRDQLAQQLVKDGATEETVQLVARHCRRTYGEDYQKRVGSLVRILSGPWQQQVPDFKRFEEKEAAAKPKEEKKRKGKAEPGLNERNLNQASQDKMTADWYGMTVRELQWFKYRFICAEWRHNCYTEEQVCESQPKGMGCTVAELRTWSVEFPQGRTLENALAIYAGKTTAVAVEAEEAKEAEQLAKVKAATRKKNAAGHAREQHHDAGRPWSRNEYSETADAKMETRRRLNDASSSGSD